MSIIACTKPYDVVVEGDDDLSDVAPSERFRREFPHGAVPICNAEHIVKVDGGNIVDRLFETLAVFEEARRRCHLRAEDVFVLVGELEALGEDTHTRAERVRILGELLHAGLSLRTVGNLTRIPTYRLVQWALGQWSTSRPAVEVTEAALDADEAIAEGLGDSQVEYVSGAPHSVVAQLRRVRAGAYEAAMKRAFELKLDGYGTAAVVRMVATETGVVIKYHTVHWLTRTESKVKRSCARFGIEYDDACRRRLHTAGELAA